MREFAKIVVITVFILIVGTFIAALISHLLKEQQVKADAQKLQELYPNILEGASTGPENLTVDYSSQPISIGSPLIFGGSHHPPLDHQDAWDKIAEAGITMIRMDINIERELPNNISLNDYKTNTNNVQDPQNWDQNDIDNIQNVYQNAKQRNMKVMAIMSYSPAWLNHSNTIFGVPKDWAVYKDIVKKSYKLHRDNIDYVEIWNEPSYEIFLDLKGSNMSRTEAYKQIFKTATQAIREVDKELDDGKRVKIGGPVSHRPFDTEVLEVILEDQALIKELDFISYHNYEAEHLPEPSDVHFRKIMKEYNLEHLPIFLTEWNYHPGWDRPNPYNTSNKAITYVGNKFISFLTMGLAGANYHVIEPVNQKWPNGGENLHSFYRWENNQADLLPQSRTWRLLSKKMGLGQGESKIFDIQNNESENNVQMVGFQNVSNQFGVIISNESTEARLNQFNFSNTKIDTYANVRIFYASAENNAEIPIYEGLLKKNKDGSINFSFYIPQESVVGIILTEENEWYKKLNLPFIYN